jgi:uncharacterized protein
MTAGGAADRARHDDSALCQSCGATWPRFSLESDAQIAAIPEALVNSRGSGMRCASSRCAALAGVIGSHASCTIYAVRPLVCRDCQPGDDECNIARARYGFPPLISQWTA